MVERRDPNLAPPRLTLDRLRDLLDTHGASSDRWPPAERDLALALIAESEHARAAFERAAALDRALDGIPAPPPSPALRRRLQAVGLPTPAPGRAARAAAALGSLREFMAGRAAAMAVSALAGLAVGVVVGAEFIATPQAELPESLAILNEGDLAAPEPFQPIPDEVWTDDGVLTLALQ